MEQPQAVQQAEQHLIDDLRPVAPLVHAVRAQHRDQLLGERLRAPFVPQPAWRAGEAARQVADDERVHQLKILARARVVRLDTGQQSQQRGKQRLPCLYRVAAGDNVRGGGGGVPCRRPHHRRRAARLSDAARGCKSSRRLLLGRRGAATEHM